MPVQPSWDEQENRVELLCGRVATARGAHHERLAIVHPLSGPSRGGAPQGRKLAAGRAGLRLVPCYGSIRGT